MADRKRRGKSPRSAAVADLFKVLKAMAADPLVKDADFRLAFRVAQSVDDKTGWAEIGDEQLTREISSSYQKVRRSRRQLEAAEWLHTVEGKRGRATLYLFLDHKAQPILEKMKAEKRAQEEAFALAQIEKRTALAVEALAFKIDGETGEVLGALGGEISPPIALSNPYKTKSSTPSDFTPPLPQSSTPRLSVKDESQEAHAPEPVPARLSVTCSECGKPAVIRCGVVGEAFCADHRWMATQDQPVE